MDNERHVGFVDTHAECVGSNHNGLAVVQKIVLILAALLGIEARVIAGGGQAAAEQQAADLLHVFAGGAVHDAALVLALVQKLEQLHALGGGLFDCEIQVGTVKTGGLDERFVQTERLHDVVAHLGGGRCGECGNERPLGQCGEKIEDLQVARTEILSPLRDTVRLIHGYHRNRHALCKFEERGRGQALGRNVQQLVLASSGEIQCIAELLEAHRAVDARSGDTGLDQRTDLIFHQRNERRNDQSQSGEQHRGHLIADGLARTGRHDAQRVAPGEDGLHQLVLSRAERIVAEILFENVLCGCHKRSFIS